MGERCQLFECDARDGINVHVVRADAHQRHLTCDVPVQWPLGRERFHDFAEKRHRREGVSIEGPVAERVSVVIICHACDAIAASAFAGGWQSVCLRDESADGLCRYETNDGSVVCE